MAFPVNSLDIGNSDFLAGFFDASTATPGFAGLIYTVDGVEELFETVGGSVTFTPGISVVPEPASLALLVAGLLGLGAARTLRRRRAA